MTRTSVWWVGAVVAVLVAGGSTSCVGAGQATSEERSSATSQPSEASDSEELGGPVLATGSVVEADGTTPAAGAEVWLEAWPPADELARLTEEGEGFELVRIAETRTDDAGGFELRLDSAAALEHFDGVDAIVDLGILAVTPTSVTSFAASVFVGEAISEDEDATHLVVTPEPRVDNPLSAGVLQLEERPER
ncbi:hypothetical protein [Actinoalloteichus caeruleus]|uniref:hypothetical protein n=1 Tax=Actinoalloteichus cyanogriseus TaxID=2893586 RepID=UPI003AAB7A50